jgi:hypothetical protein
VGHRRRGLDRVSDRRRVRHGALAALPHGRSLHRGDFDRRAQGAGCRVAWTSGRRQRRLVPVSVAAGLRAPTRERRLDLRRCGRAGFDDHSVNPRSECAAGFIRRSCHLSCPDRCSRYAEVHSRTALPKHADWIVAEVGLFRRVFRDRTLRLEIFAPCTATDDSSSVGRSPRSVLARTNRPEGTHTAPANRS